MRHKKLCWLDYLLSHRNILCFIIFVGGYSFLLYQHAFWRDELQAWEIARTSITFSSILDKLRYEGHPALWHALLWVITRFTDDPLYMKVLHGGIGAGYLAILWFLSPFKIWEKILFSASVFAVLFFVVSRNYGIAMLCAYLFAAAYYHRPHSKFMPWIALGLLANTNILAAIMSGVFALWLLSEKYQKPFKEWGWGFFVYVLMGCFAVYTTYPAQDIAPPQDMVPSQDMAAAWRVLTMLLIMAKKIFLTDFIGDNPYVLMSAGFLWFFAVYGQFISTKKLLFVIVGYCSLFALFAGLVKYNLSERHFGMIFIALVVTLFLQRSIKPQLKLSFLMVSLLVINLIASFIIVYRLAVTPYSNAHHVREWIAEQQLEKEFWVVMPDYVGAGMLKSPLYHPECHCFAYFPKWDTARADFLKKYGIRYWQNPKMLEAVLAEIPTNQHNQPFYIIMAGKLSLPKDRNFNLGKFSFERVFYVNSSTVSNEEEFTVFKVSRLGG